MISAIVLTKNSQETIRKSLESIKWCDEILIIDDNSIDQTTNIAKDYDCRIFERNLNHDYAEQRNYGLKKAKGDWILFLDSDEVVTPDLQKEIKTVITENKYHGFYIKRQDVLLGKILEYGETSRVRLLRLAKKGAGIWMRPVHEEWQIDGKIGFLSNSILHFPHASMRNFLESINNYSTINAEYLFKKGESVTLFDIFIFPLGKFIQNYIIRMGLRDQVPGVIMAVMMSFHSFLTRSKLYLLKKKK